MCKQLAGCDTVNINTDTCVQKHKKHSLPKRKCKTQFRVYNIYLVWALIPSKNCNFLTLLRQHTPNIHQTPKYIAGQTIMYKNSIVQTRALNLIMIITCEYFILAQNIVSALQHLSSMGVNSKQKLQLFKLPTYTEHQNNIAGQTIMYKNSIAQTRALNLIMIIICKSFILAHSLPGGQHFNDLRS